MATVRACQQLLKLAGHLQARSAILKFGSAHFCSVRCINGQLWCAACWAPAGLLAGSPANSGHAGRMEIQAADLGEPGVSKPGFNLSRRMRPGECRREPVEVRKHAQPE